MAEKLAQGFERARKLGGKKAEMRLAILTGMTIIRAKQEPDSSENLTKFSRAMFELSKEFQGMAA